ncbi:MAG: hypothetical protein ABEH60_03825 [Halonotius sp.]
MVDARLARFDDTVTRTRAAMVMTLRRRDGQAVFAVVTVVYLLVYLWGIGHLAAGLGGFSVTVVDDPFATLLQSEGAFSFRPIARVALGPFTYLASLNTLLGGGVAALVGLNLSLSYLAWRQPAACGIGQSSSGLLAGIPALLSGTACCGPVVLIAVGIQASSALLTAFQFLLPATVLMLIGSLLLVGRQVTVAQ